MQIGQHFPLFFSLLPSPLQFLCSPGLRNSLYSKSELQSRFSTAVHSGTLWWHPMKISVVLKEIDSVTVCRSLYDTFSQWILIILHGLKFSVAMTDFHHSNFTEATCEISVDRWRTSVGWFLLTHSTANGIANSVCVPDQWQCSDPHRAGSKHGAALKISCLA